MIEFLGSVGFVGWIAIGVALACFWNLPKFIRGHGAGPKRRDKMQAGEDPPIFRPPTDDGM